jgi:hypothetical protein
MTQIELLDGLPHPRLRSELGLIERRDTPVLATRHPGIQLPLWPNKHGEVRRIRALSLLPSKRT